MFNDAKPSPPINNLLQPDIYNRLDAEAIERTRVINTQLDERLRVQQKILAKYRQVWRAPSWMDGWMDGRMGGRMMDGWMERQMDERWMDG